MSATDDTAATILRWLRNTGRRLPIPPASDADAWAAHGDNPHWSRDAQLAAVAALRACGLVTITTEAYAEDVADDDPGVTIYVHLADRS